MTVLWAGGDIVFARERENETAKKSLSDSKWVTVQGKISVKGNEPHTYLCISTKEGLDYKLVGSLKDEIRARYQHVILHVSGKFTGKALGPGFPAELDVFEYTESDKK